MEKLLTITGTGRAMAKTPAIAHNPPMNIPGKVFGVMSP